MPRPVASPSAAVSRCVGPATWRIVASTSSVTGPSAPACGFLASTMSAPPAIAARASAADDTLTSRRMSVVLEHRPDLAEPFDAGSRDNDVEAHGPSYDRPIHG